MREFARGRMCYRGLNFTFSAPSPRFNRHFPVLPEIVVFLALEAFSEGSPAKFFIQLQQATVSAFTPSVFNKPELVHFLKVYSR